MKPFEPIIANKPDLEKKSQYCSKCNDDYWNHKDCDSIRETGLCGACYRGEELI